jgi:hypothetical protein
MSNPEPKPEYVPPPPPVRDQLTTDLPKPKWFKISKLEVKMAEAKPEYVPPPPPVRDQFTADKPKPKWLI